MTMLYLTTVHVLTDQDQEQYKDFNMVVSERWQQEVTETVFDAINSDTDKRKRFYPDDLITTDGQTDCIVEGEVSRLGNSFMQQTWQKTHLKLFPNRLEFYPKKDGQIIRKTGVEMISMMEIKQVWPELQKMNKVDCILIHLKDNDQRIHITSPDRILLSQWKDEIVYGFQKSTQILSTINKKASRMIGANFGDSRLSAAVHSCLIVTSGEV
ncbi:ADRBK2 [Bugula neritina]|uniref:ADRBK2 n=1 Tax=Bugula neritina TaxID=10212 RepID=A0A7J7KJG9_BUGNE|nr:ADRBK2 [Bugula neritina]